MKAIQTSGYCGADLKSLCVEAALASLRRRYPQIYKSQNKLVIKMEQVVPSRKDFETALNKIVPASRRSISIEWCALPKHLEVLLGGEVRTLKAVFKQKNWTTPDPCQ